jgi:hypothetical protein
MPETCPDFKAIYDNSICIKCKNGNICDKVTVDKTCCENFKCKDNQCANCQFRIEDIGGYVDCIAEH